MTEAALIGGLFATFCVQQAVIIAILRSGARERTLLLNAALARTAVEQNALNKSSGAGSGAPRTGVLPGTKAPTTDVKPPGHRNPLGM